MATKKTCNRCKMENLTWAPRTAENQSWRLQHSDGTIHTREVCQSHQPAVAPAPAVTSVSFAPPAPVVAPVRRSSLERLRAAAAPVAAPKLTQAEVEAQDEEGLAEMTDAGLHAAMGEAPRRQRATVAASAPRSAAPSLPNEELLDQLGAALALNNLSRIVELRKQILDRMDGIV